MAERGDVSDEAARLDLRAKLLKKLQGGNKRFVHLNATIGRSRGKLDLLNLNEIEKGLAESFLEHLMGDRKLSFSIPLKHIQAKVLDYKNADDAEAAESKQTLAKLKRLLDTKKKLEVLEATQKEEESEFGTKSFAFGYPLLVKHVGSDRANKDDIICAPLFIWYLDISRRYTDDSVVLSRDEDNPILFNEMLDYYMLDKQNLDFSAEVIEINSSVLDDGLMERHELQASLATLLKKISPDIPVDIDAPLQVVPEKPDALKALLKESGTTQLLLNAGVFGIYKAGKQSIINDLKALMQQAYEVVEKPDTDLDNDYEATAIQTDPSQTQVIESVAKHQNLIIQGPPGTGKSQTLTALITHALANRRRTLVVCEKRTAMDIIARNLEKAGLGNYFAVVENVNRDRSGIVNKARDLYDNRMGAKYKVQSEMTAALTNYTEALNQVNRHHRHISTMQLKDLGDRKHVLGTFWQRRHSVPAESLSLLRDSFAQLPLSYEKVEYQQVVEELDRNLKLAQQSPGGLESLPKTAVTAHGSYTADRSALEGYFGEIEQRLQAVQTALAAFAVRQVELYAEGLRASLAAVKAQATTALTLLNVPADQFNWPALKETLTGSGFAGSDDAQHAVDQLDRLQELSDKCAAERQAAEAQTLAVLQQYTDDLALAQQQVNSLISLGIVEFGSLRGDKLGTLFNSHRKEIKGVKAAVAESLKRLNRQKASLAAFVPAEPLHFNETLAPALAAHTANIPTSAQVRRYYDDLPASHFLGDAPELQGKDISVQQLSAIVSRRQATIYGSLQHDIWGFYRDAMATLQNDFLRQALHWEAASAAAGTAAIEFLTNVLSASLAPTVLHSAAQEAVEALPIGTQQALTEARTAVLAALQLQTAYAPMWTRQNYDLNGAVTYGSLSRTVAETVQAVNAAEGAVQDHDFFGYYSWCEQYAQLKPYTRAIMDMFETTGVDRSLWQDLFSALYFEHLFVSSDGKELLKNEMALDQLISSDRKIKSLLIDTIESFWSGERLTRIGSFESGSLRFASLYNKRGAAGQRRNSLRKIVERDFRLFTALFPVVICNPETTTSLFKLQKDLFDVVLFDEASQLRLEDTYTSLYRGAIKIISGDEHQMPPSNYFMGAVADDDTEYEADEDLQIGESLAAESLLDYAGINSYKKTMLQIHYRSDHADLIEFSNHAFYGGKLLPITKLEDYRPIEFVRVDGEYSDHINSGEAQYILQWLKDYCRSTDNYQSIGVATLNINQAEYIKETISNERVNDPQFESRMSWLEENGFFVKNLENIQGDERDIIILSTTYGKNPEGKFLQNFNPRMTQKGGYRLLNVLVTRAKHKLIVATSVPDDFINRYPDELVLNGKDGRAIFYAYLAYARAVSAGDEDSKRHILSLLNDSTDDQALTPWQSGQTESPFEEEVLAAIENEVDPSRVVLQYPVGSEKFRIDMVVLDKHKQRPILAIECDGYAYHSSPQAYLYDTYRQQILEDKGFTFYRIWSTNWFHDPYTETNKLIRQIQTLDAAV